jgi:CRP-like cAMP-binding protein
MRISPARRRRGRGFPVQYVILGALSIAALVIGVDIARERRRVRRLPNVHALIDRHRSDGNAQPLFGRALTSALARSTPGPDAEEDSSTLGGLWDALVDRVDPEFQRPKLADGVEIARFALRWGNDYAVVASPDHETHFYLQPWEADLMDLMDGSRATQELIVAHLRGEGDLDPSAVLGLVSSLHEAGFLDPRPLDAAALVRDRLDPASPGRRKLRGFAKDLKIGWDGADAFVSALHRRFLRYFWLPPVAALAGLFAVVGLACFLSVNATGRFKLSTTAAPADTVLLLLLGFLLTFAHELGHAVVLTHHGRKVISAGFFIFFGSPAFYVNSSDGLMMNRRQRLLQSFAGPFAELFLAGFTGVILFLFPDSPAAPFLYRFALINYFIIFLNLIPLLELDGYWILSDLIQVPDLRPRSLAFIQGDLWHKLRARDRMTLQEAALGLYGVVGLVFTIFSFYTAVFFWHAIFGGMIGALWRGGLGSRILLLVLALFFAGPVIRGLLSLARATLKRVRALAARIRFFGERSWRVEAAGLIDSLPAFEDLPEDVLSDLAGRVRLVTLRPEQALFHQGDRADAFYVVRRGQMALEDEDRETGDTRVIRTAGRGDAFGELGLLGEAPRSATARSIGYSELFRVDGSTFDRLLADSIDAPDFGPTMQSLGELRGLAPFGALSTEDLATLSAHGSWVIVPPGEAIMEQGEPGDAFYAIGSGQADVLKDGQPIATLGPGQYFGEVALLEDVPRTASVVARTPMRVFRLDDQGFDAVVASSLRRGPIDRKPDRNMEH